MTLKPSKTIAYEIGRPHEDRMREEAPFARSIYNEWNQMRFPSVLFDFYLWNEKVHWKS